MAGELEEIEVAERGRELHVTGGLEPHEQAGGLEPRLGSRVQREDHALGQALDQLHEAREALGDVHVAGAVRREHQIGARREPARLEDRRALLGDVAKGERDVGHDVADQVRLAGGGLAAQVLHRGRSRAQQEVARVIGQHAVELLWHRAVERAHAGLDVPDRDAVLGSGERTGERGVRVAVDERQVRLELGQYRLQREQHARGLLGVRARADAQLTIRRGHAELVEEDLGELVVIVLARVHDQLLVLLAQQPRHRGGLYELRAVANDRKDSHGSGLEWFEE